MFGCVRVTTLIDLGQLVGCTTNTFHFEVPIRVSISLVRIVC